jgi:hypothetical protein
MLDARLRIRHKTLELRTRLLDKYGSKAEEYILKGDVLSEGKGVWCEYS